MFARRKLEGEHGRHSGRVSDHRGKAVSAKARRLADRTRLQYHKITLVDGREYEHERRVTRNHMEVRGIGIINVYHVRGSEHPPKKQVDLIVRNLE